MPQIGLQFSVHESTDDARNMLVPFKAKLTLAEIAAQGEKWAAATGRQPFFNYCAHEKNTSQDDVDRLSGLYNPDLWQCTVSVVCERDEGVAAANARQRGLASDFMEKMAFRGYSTRMFDPAGQDDIGGGCGQLWYVQEWMRKNAHLGRETFRQLPVVHAPHLEPTP
jgi:23S rRNA (adenine2503-C2)-methyltransferase